jgi:NAD(P)-dependent dehydrogenase (short-subunit alcohol dehydrogenase family)
MSGRAGAPGERSVVVTGASRGLGLASAVHLHRLGWHVVAAMRTPEAGLTRIRAEGRIATDDPRLTAVRLDLDDPASIDAAADEVVAAVGAPDALVHNAGIVSVGCVEELPPDVFEAIFRTNVLGAVRLTAALLPAMRAAGAGRIVVVSSEGAVHGMPAITAYSASKGALERWAEGLALEVAPFGIGVSVLVTGTFDTDIIDREHTATYGAGDGPYAFVHEGQGRLEGRVKQLAGSPATFAAALGRALDDDVPFRRRAVGIDARLMRVGRFVLPAGAFQRVVRVVLAIPAPGSLRTDARRLLPVSRASDR